MFYWHVLCRAVADTYDFFRHHLRVGLILALIAVVLSAVIRDANSARDAAISGGISVAAMAVLMLVIFVGNLILAPIKLYRELWAQGEDLAHEIQGQADDDAPRLTVEVGESARPNNGRTARLKVTNVSKVQVIECQARLVSVNQTDAYGAFHPDPNQKLMWAYAANPLSDVIQVSLNAGESEYVNVAYTDYDLRRFAGSGAEGREALMDRAYFQFAVIDAGYKMKAGRYELEIQVSAANGGIIPVSRWQLTFRPMEDLELAPLDVWGGLPAALTEDSNGSA